MALPFTGIVDQLLENLKRDKFVEVKTSQMGLGEGAYLYAITGAGSDRAREAMERSQYAGPAPVPIQEYNESVLRQAQGRPTVSNRMMHQGLIPSGPPRVNFRTHRSSSQFRHLNFHVWSTWKWQDQRCPSDWEYDPA